jgi:hypothetical protein
MHRVLAIAAGLAFIAVGALSSGYRASGQTGWVTLFDGKSLDSWTHIGNADWKLADGVVTADKGSGFLVSKGSYGNFELRVEFWVDEDANSGIFIRCTNPEKVGTDSAYEVNIFDKRPEPVYGTGAIVNVAKVDPMPKAGGKWNLYEITAKGPVLTVVLNAQKTVDGARDSRFAAGRIALQYGSGAVKDKGVVKFRKVEVRPL